MALSRIQISTLATLGANKTAHVCLETVGGLQVAGLVSEDVFNTRSTLGIIRLTSDDLTEAGRTAAGMMAAKAEIVRNAKNRASRERNAALSEMGLKRTSDGWQ